MKSVIRKSWSRVVKGTGGIQHDDFFQLACQYSQLDRHYHNLGHIVQMASQLLAIESETAGEDSYTDLHRAIWWHDCVYDSRAKDNEERSAEEMVKTLRSWGVGQPACDRAHALVMLTKTHNVPENDEDGKLLVDLDLSILAASEAQYDVYAAAIRQEYGWVAEEDYRKGRLAFLQSMLEKKSIFSSPHTTEWHDRQARRNIESEAQKLVM